MQSNLKAHEMFAVIFYQLVSLFTIHFWEISLQDVKETGDGKRIASSNPLEKSRS